MKREKAGILFCVCCLLCLLSACGEREPAETDWSEAQMSRAVWDAQGPGEYQMLQWGDEDFTRYVRDYYQVDPAELAGGAVFFAGGVSAREVAVLRLKDPAGGKTAEAALRAYITGREGAFAGYAPEQYAILKQSVTACRGTYAALLIGPYPEEAREAFSACFTSAPPEEEPALPGVPSGAPAQDGPLPPASPEDTPPEPEEPEPSPEPRKEPEEEPLLEEPPEEEPPKDQELLPEEPDAPPEEPDREPPEPWSYDSARLVSAWQNGGREGLPEEDLAILEICDQISALSDSSLTDYQRELALHDWMLAWAEYDPGALDNNPQGSPMPHNDNPYGFLTGKKGICLGYASTFQLLMEMSGIECVTVHGMSHGNTEEHAWNLVKLDGDWYAVDVTWDDPVASFSVPRSMAHQYFNVTSEYLRQTDHQWDASAVPEAEGQALSWQGD